MSVAWWGFNSWILCSHVGLGFFLIKIAIQSLWHPKIHTRSCLLWGRWETSIINNKEQMLSMLEGGMRCFLITSRVLTRHKDKLSVAPSEIIFSTSRADFLLDSPIRRKIFKRIHSTGVMASSLFAQTLWGWDLNRHIHLVALRQTPPIKNTHQWLISLGSHGQGFFFWAT